MAGETPETGRGGAVTWQWAGPFMAGICLALLAVLWDSTLDRLATLKDSIAATESARQADHDEMVRAVAVAGERNQAIIELRTDVKELKEQWNITFKVEPRRTVPRFGR